MKYSAENIIIKGHTSCFGNVMGYWGYIDEKLIWGSYGKSEDECLVNSIRIANN